MESVVSDAPLGFSPVAPPVVGTQDANCGAPERTSPTSWRSHVTEYANIRRHPRYISTESEKCPVERPMTGQNTHFEQLIR